MAEPYSNSAAVSFLDRDRVLTELKQAVRDARRRYPEIVKVLLVGSDSQHPLASDPPDAMEL